MSLVIPNPPPMPEFVKADFIRRMKRDGWVVQRSFASLIAVADYLYQKFSALYMPMMIICVQQYAMTPLSLVVSMHHASPQSVLSVYGCCGHSPS